MLPGQFIPKNLQKRRDVVFLGEKPSLHFVRHPQERNKGNYNATATDFTFQKWIQKFLKRAVYVTDMVKTEGKAGAPFEREWKKDQKFFKILLDEIKTLNPKVIVAMSDKVAKLFASEPGFAQYNDKLRQIYHPAYVMRYRRFRAWDTQFKRVVRDLSR